MEIKEPVPSRQNLVEKVTAEIIDLRPIVC